jgi:hypothetical protein
MRMIVQLSRSAKPAAGLLALMVEAWPVHASHIGQVVPVQARVERIDSMSAHADAGEIMARSRGGIPRTGRVEPAIG